MRIVVWGINYAPEVAGIGPHNTALCEYLKRERHDVEMLTTFCYYPAWRKLPEDEHCIYRTDNMDGIPVHRCWHYVPDRPGNRLRILHELSFIITSTLRFLALKRPDFIVVVSPPLLIGAAAWLVGLVKRAPFIFHVQDLQPDGAVGLGMLKTHVFVRALYKLEAFAYRKAHRVSGISPGMLEVFFKKQVPASKQLYFPNTVVLPKNGELQQRGRFRAKHGLGPDEFLALHSGNLGVKHGLQILVEASRFIKNKRIKILICGDGTARNLVADLIAQRGAKNILMLSLQADSDYRDMLADADICFITQEKGSGRSFFPSKLLNALAYSKPVFAVADAESELSRVLDEGGFGVKVPPDEPETLALELDRVSTDPEMLARLGAAGRKFVGQFERERVFAEFVRTGLR